MSTYALLPRDHLRVVPAGVGVFPIFLDAELARSYREEQGWTGDCEVIELPAIEVLRAMLVARQQGISHVAVNAIDGGRVDRLELTLDDPWSAFADFMQFEQGRLSRVPAAEIPKNGFSDPRLHHERPQTLPAGETRSEHDAAVVDLTAAQLLSQAGSVELAKHALDHVAETQEEPTDPPRDSSTDTDGAPAS